MWEEVETLGYPIGTGCLIEELIGSTWTDKISKDEIMNHLLNKLGVSGKNVLVIGDGRSEISAGVKMGAVTIGRLAEDAEYQRSLLRKLGVHCIVEDFERPELKKVLHS